MADEQNKPNPSEGAGTKAHKPTKAELAKLPGGEDFDAEGASSEDFDRHYEILARRAKLAGLVQPAAAPAATTPAAIVPAAPLAPAPGDVRMVKGDEERYFNPITLDALGEDRQGWKEAVAKPSDI